MEEYLELTPAQRKLVKKDKIHELLELQLTRHNVSGVGVEELKLMISGAVKEAIGELKDEIGGFRKEVDDLKDELNTIKDERNTLKKVISEQQKFLETLKRDKVKDNIFIAGIPNSLNISGADTSDNAKIVHHILSFIDPNTSVDDYKMIKEFEPRQGLPRHSCLNGFTNINRKKNILDNSKKLNGLAEDNLLKKVYVKNEQTPLTRKENSRIYGEFKKLQQTHEGDETKQVKLERGKLYLNGDVVDEFSLTNQLF
jgi:hypothetical protein